MKLVDIVRRTVPPNPWEEGDKIPWDDPDFSQRMLHEHLSQAHDLASRRTVVIDQHVAWIHHTLLGGQPGRILDLCCGPGLYTLRLASLGHECVGIDFSPAAIEHAREQALAHRYACSYRQGDVRTVDYDDGYNLIMLIFGEFNMFSREDASTILRKARLALAPAGKLLLEVHTYEFIEAMGQKGTSWRSSAGGLFSERPHLVLSEHFWHEQQRIATQRTFVIDGETSAVARYVETAQAYTLNGYTSVLREAGFAVQASPHALPGSPESGELIALLAGIG